MKYTIIPLLSQPGIQRDGTQYDAKSCVDAQWTRWYKNRPRKMGGYEVISYGDTVNLEITNTLFSSPAQGNTINLFYGRPSTIALYNYDQNQTQIGSSIDLTPTGFSSSPNNNWTMDLAIGFDDGAQFLLAHSTENWNDVSNVIKKTAYYAQLAIAPATQGILQPIQAATIISNPAYIPPPPPTDIPPYIPGPSTNFQCNGGILYLSPLMIAYDNGTIYWSQPGVVDQFIVESEDPNTPPNIVQITNTKIIYIAPARGGNVSGGSTPSMLVWSLNSLLKATFTLISDAEATFSYQVIQNNISIMSAKSVVEYNQVFYWIGENQFFYYNGIVNKLVNTMNTDYFFKNLTYDSRAKVFGVANPRYDEIWWFYPRNGSTECNACIIYNVEMQVWYDSFLSRAAAILPTTVAEPIMASSSTISVPIGTSLEDVYPIWLHEIGFDQSSPQGDLPIDSYYQTHFIDLFSNNPDNANFLYTRRICPNFDQIGTMNVSVIQLQYPDDPSPIILGPFPFDPNTTRVDDVVSQGMLTSFRFDSNITGGYFQGGKMLLWYTVGDELR